MIRNVSFGSATSLTGQRHRAQTLPIHGDIYTSCVPGTSIATHAPVASHFVWGAEVLKSGA